MILQDKKGFFFSDGKNYTKLSEIGGGTNVYSKCGKLGKAWDDLDKTLGFKVLFTNLKCPK